MNLTQYRASPSERLRTEDLLRLTPPAGGTALDIGARDGHFSRLLAERFDKVTALDLTKPAVEHPRVECVEGNAADLAFADRTFDFVLCAEVLEHIPRESLGRVCREIERVARSKILVGVPYRQDIRIGRTTCSTCKGRNPPWGHVNVFDERRLTRLFPACRVDQISFVGTSREQTNSVSALLMDLAGNPHGTYTQGEPCIHCGATLTPPPERTFPQWVVTMMAVVARRATAVFARPRGNWIHLLLSRKDEA